MTLNSIRPDLVRFEMKMVQGQDPNAREQKKPGAFARFLSGVGKVLGAVAAPLSFIFPPAAIAAAGMYGLGTIGDRMQAKTYQKQAQKAQEEAATQVSFPGLMMGGGPTPASFESSAGDYGVTDVLGARGNSMNEMSQRI